MDSMSSQPTSKIGKGAEISGAGHPATAPGQYSAVTFRAVLLGMFGAVWITILQLVSKVWPQTVVLPLQSALTLLSGPIFWLFVLAVVNAPLKRRIPGAALRAPEFAVIYAISTVAAAIAAQDEVMQLFPMLVYPFRATQDTDMGPFRAFIPT